MNTLSYLMGLQTGILSSALEKPCRSNYSSMARNPGEAISAVKALQKANAQGQRIYHITQANQATILSNIHHDPDTMAEIKNALNAGQEVITHADAVSVLGWTGAGYIITDPVTGDGAYKISGGANGGWWSGFFSGISVGAVIAMIGLMMTEVLKVSVSLALFSGIFSTLVLGAYLLLVLAIVVTEIQLIYYSDEKLASCYWGGFGLGNAVGGLVPGQAYITSLINFILAFIFAKSVDSATYESCVK